MKIVITGTTQGIGKAIALKFLQLGHNVIGIDKQPSSITDKNYTHYKADVFSDVLPEICDVEILVNNAGEQDGGRDIDVNLKGAIKVTEKYAVQPKIKALYLLLPLRQGAERNFPNTLQAKAVWLRI